MMANVYGLLYGSCQKASYPNASHLPHPCRLCMRVHTGKHSMPWTKAGKESLRRFWVFNASLD